MNTGPGFGWGVACGLAVAVLAGSLGLLAVAVAQEMRAPSPAISADSREDSEAAGRAHEEDDGTSPARSATTEADSATETPTPTTEPAATPVPPTSTPRPPTQSPTSTPTQTPRPPTATPYVAPTPYRYNPAPAPTISDDLEPVVVVKLLDSNNVIIQRRYSQWLIDYGVGCLSLWRYEGDVIYLTKGHIGYIGIGAELVLPNGDTCRVWGSEEL